MRNVLNQTMSRALLGLAVGCAAVACDASLSERIIAVRDGGRVILFLYVDANLNGQFNSGVDPQIRSARMSLRMKGAVEDAQTASTDTAGFAAFIVPPGRYRALVHAGVLGDSLEIFRGAHEFTVSANDTIQLDVSLAFPQLAPTQARAAPLNKKFWLTGIAANFTGIFGDSSVHVLDGTRAMRALRFRFGGISPGDSVLLFGTRSTRDGQPTFDVQSFSIRGQLNPPSPDTLSTALAATADGGRRDARLAIVRNAVIGDTATAANGSRLLRVDDGSGPTWVVLSSTISFAPLNQFALGVRLDVTGLLLPDPAAPSRWQLKPRARSDIAIRP